MKYIVTLLLLCSILQAASAQSKRKLKKEMNSWMGSTKHELVLAYGPPARVSSDGSNGEILVFSDIYQYYTNTYAPVRTGGIGLETTGSELHQYYLHKMYYIDSKGVVYGWRWQKSPFPIQQVDVNANVNLNVHSR